MILNMIFPSAVLLRYVVITKWNMIGNITTEDIYMQQVGNIKRRVDDADFLIENKKYESALLLLLTAIDGSAIKVFPAKTQSITNPTRTRKNRQIANEMPNSERYQRFLGVRIRQLLGIMLSEDEYYAKELIHFVEGQEDPEVIIYKAFRCNDVHESSIPTEYHYVYSEDAISNNLSMEFSNGTIKFSSGFLSLLRSAIVYAPCNGSEFGISHFRLMPNDGMTEDDIYNHCNNEYGVSYGKVIVINRLLADIGPGVHSLDLDELSEIIVESIHPGTKTGLSFPRGGKPACISNNRFTESGKSMLNYILKNSQVVDIAS
ncbi:TPA: hypothetical protein MHW38_11680 [Klebsiella pneumoniae]|nr:hypothetical protein [Klebsiella pneumoniae]